MISSEYDNEGKKSIQKPQCFEIPSAPSVCLSVCLSVSDPWIHLIPPSAGSPRSIFPLPPIQGTQYKNKIKIKIVVSFLACVFFFFFGPGLFSFLIPDDTTRSIRLSPPPPPPPTYFFSPLSPLYPLPPLLSEDRGPWENKNKTERTGLRFLGWGSSSSCHPSW